MKVKSISIQNLKSYPKADIELSPSINLLIGENNSGKTTIIQSLLNLQYRPFQKKDIRSQESFARTVIRLIDVSETDLLLFRGKNNKSIQYSESLDVFWQIGNTPAGTLVEESLFAASQDNLWGSSGIKSKKSKASRVDEKFSEFPLFPDAENKSNYIFPFLAKRKTDYYDYNLNQENYFKIQEGMRNIGARIHRLENPSHPRHNRFVSLCEDILGFKIGVIPIDQQNGNGFEPGMYVTSTSMIPIRSMGEGVVNILGFIVTLLTEDNKLVLVEELENDIHPRALKKLLSLIVEKSENNQFVISTHSHIVLKYLGAINSSKIFYTETINNYSFSPIPTSRITQVKNDPASRMAVLEKLGYEFNDFELFSGYLVLEESSAECIIRDFIMPNFVPELYGKLRTVAARGVDELEARMSDFHRLFVFIHTNPIYHQRAWVIADGDKAGKDCISRLKNKFTTWHSEHFLNFSKSNFEEFYPERFQKDVERAFRLHGEQKQKAKAELITDVMKWTLENRNDALREFSQSASEVINILKAINKKISTKQRQKNHRQKK